MAEIFNDEQYMLWRLLRQASSAILKVRQRELAEYGISHRKAGVLLIAEATDGKATLYEMAKWFIIEPNTISELSQRMEKEGFIIKKIDNRNKRKSTRIELTEKGREACKQIRKMESIHKIMSSVSDKDREQLALNLKALRDEALKRIGVKYKLHFPPF
jgi:DNA-binding MarR family transcriptional regulator